VAARSLVVTRSRRLRPNTAYQIRLHWEEISADKPPELVRDLLARIVEKVTLHYDEAGQVDSLGRSRRPLSHIDVTFRPEVAHLFGSGCNRSPHK
jgi:hypothetical protein